MSNLSYPDPVENLDRQINLWTQLKTETGAAGVADKVAEIKALVAEKLAELRALPDDPALRQAEPDDLPGIRALRPDGERRYWTQLPRDTYRDRLEAAILGRFSGCVLGSIVECWEVDQMARWAEYLGDAFPPPTIGARPSARRISNIEPARAKTSPALKWMVCPPMTTSSIRSWVC